MIILDARYASSYLNKRNVLEIELLGFIFVQEVVLSRMINPNTNHHYSMTYNTIQKRCSRCDNIFNIPRVNKGRTFLKILDLYPCTFCGYRVDGNGIGELTSGRCISCSIPFIIIKEHCKGMCHRCYMRKWRITNVTK